MKQIEKISEAYERLKELDKEILSIQKMKKKLAEGDPDIINLELKIHFKEKEEYSDSYTKLESRHSPFTSGIFNLISASSKEIRMAGEFPLMLEYYNAIVFLDFLENQKEKQRLSITEFLSQFENRKLC